MASGYKSIPGSVRFVAALTFLRMRVGRRYIPACAGMTRVGDYGLRAHVDRGSGTAESCVPSTRGLHGTASVARALGEEVGV